MRETCVKNGQSDISSQQNGWFETHMFYPILLVKRGPPLLTLFGSKIDSVTGTALSKSGSLL